MTASTASHRVPTASRAKDAVSGRASRNPAENGNRVPPTASPRPTASRPRPDRFPALLDETSGTASRAIYKRDAGRGSSQHPGLTPWLTDLKLRNLTIDITTDGPRITGHRTDLITPTDWHQLNRHRHALELAATGQHPAWWNHVLGHTDRIHLHDMPTVNDPDDRHGGYGFPCATCGQPAEHLDHRLLPWCGDHA